MLYELFIKNTEMKKCFQLNYPRKITQDNQETTSFYNSKYYREHPYSSIQLQSRIYRKYSWIIEIGDFIQLKNKLFGQVLSIFLLNGIEDEVFIDIQIFIKAIQIDINRHKKEIVCTDEILENVALNEVSHFLKVCKHL